MGKEWRDMSLMQANAISVDKHIGWHGQVVLYDSIM